MVETWGMVRRIIFLLVLRRARQKQIIVFSMNELHLLRILETNSSLLLVVVVGGGKLKYQYPLVFGEGILEEYVTKSLLQVVVTSGSAILEAAVAA